MYGEKRKGAFFGLLEEKGIIAEALGRVPSWALSDLSFRAEAGRVLGTGCFSVADVREEGFRAYKERLSCESVSFSMPLRVFVRGEGQEEAKGVRAFASCACRICDDGVRLLSVSMSPKDPGRAGVPLDGDLVPVLPSSRYDAVARGMLERYLPGAGEGAPLDTEALASAMGVGVYFHPIERDGSVLGLASMREGEVCLYDPEKGRKARYLLPGMSMVIDREAHGGRETRLRMTEAHEAVHLALHAQVYALRRLLGDDASFHRLSACPKGEVPAWTRWSETHASGIAPSLLMPEGAFRRKADEICLGLRREGPVTPEGVEGMVKGLASAFGVSAAAAKRRLVSLGYERARGACNFVDGRYIRPYSFREGSLPPGETFEVSEAQRLLIPDARCLSRAFFPFPTARFRYVFVDGHLAADIPRFVTREGGEPALTDYAYSHMDECCARFDFSGTRRWERSAFASVGKPFTRLNMPADVSSSLLEEAGVTDRMRLEMSDATIKKTDEYFAVLEGEGAETLGGALRRLMDHEGLRVSDVVERTGIEESEIYRYLGGERKPTLRKLVAMCVALRLPPEVTRECLGRARFRLDAVAYPEDRYLNFVVECLFLCDVWRINVVLTRHGEKPLTSM